MKKLVSCLSLLLALLMLASCGATSDTAAAEYSATEAAYDVAVDTEAALPEEAPAEAPAPEPNQDGVSGLTEGDQNLSEKIIYSAYAELETTEFEKSVDAIYGLLEKYNAFLESSTVNGSNLSDTARGTASHRSAYFTLRVPRECYGSMTEALETVGNVTYLSSDATNITAQYTDTEALLASYQFQEERLLDIMAQADNVEDMIDLESRLSEVRYEKDALTAQLKNWDNQVSYSSVSISLQEVQVLTPEPLEERSYWQQVGDGFVASLRWLWNAAKVLLRLFVAALPILAPAALIAGLIIWRCRRKKKRRESTPESKS